MNKVYIVANDYYVKNLVLFLESYKHRLGDLSNIICSATSISNEKVLKVLDIYKVQQFVDPLFDKDFDTFLNLYSNKLPQDINILRAKFNKLRLFNLVDETVIYMDIDGFLANQFFLKILNADFDKFYYMINSPGWVYNNRKYPEEVGSSEISTCFFIKPKFFPNYYQIFNFIADPINVLLFNANKMGGVFDQPIINFFLDGKKIIPERLTNLYPEIFYGINSLDFNEFESRGDGICVSGKLVPYIHHSKNYPYSDFNNIFSAFYYQCAVTSNKELVKILEGVE